MKTSAWRAAVRLTQPLARPTSALRPPPDFLLAGVQRGGSTSLFEYLLTHPAILGPRLTKGVHWFDTAYDRSMSWYRSHFPTRLQRAAAERRAGEPVVAGEACGYYLFHPYVPARIAADLPDARVIVILRDPVERAWSHHRHEVARGYEDLEFEAALDAEAARLAGQDALLAARDGRSFAHQHHGYVARGRYVEQLERLWDAVGVDRVHVAFTEELDADADAVLGEIHGFLGVSRRPLGIARRWNVKSAAPMPAHVRRRLRATFAPHDAALAARLGRDLPWDAAE